MKQKKRIGKGYTTFPMLFSNTTTKASLHANHEWLSQFDYNEVEKELV